MPDNAADDGRSWFDAAGFGLFVHWGIYSAQGWEPSWPLVGGVPVFTHCQDIPADDYRSRAPDFAPPEGAPREWMRVARRAGMRYAVLTTKHHDGYALFPHDTAPFGVSTHLPGRDLVREFVDAARAEELRVGLYFSLPDWSHQHYPAFSDDDRPYNPFAMRRASPEQWQQFRSDMLDQLHHLMTAYGTIDIVWFDGGWERSAGEWGSHEIEALLRDCNPDVLITDRLPGVADVTTPEQGIPHPVPTGRWETCMTMADSWGPIETDLDHKSTRYLLMALTEIVSNGGNLLLNISPDGNGEIPVWQRERLDDIAAWMTRHGDAVHDVDRGLEPWQFPGPTTRSRDGSQLYLICPMQPRELVVLRQVRGRAIRSIATLGTGTELTWRLQFGAIEAIMPGDDVLCDVLIDIPEAAPDGGPLLDEMITVLQVTFT
jgi:alpha-L-fucosidase